jgi:hypothetical protein
VIGDGPHKLQRARRGQQCQANSSASTVQLQSRYWHVCQLSTGHGGLHSCFCGQLFDDQGEHFTWENITMPTVWTVKETNEPR